MRKFIVIILISNLLILLIFPGCKNNINNIDNKTANTGAAGEACAFFPGNQYYLINQNYNIVLIKVIGIKEELHFFDSEYINCDICSFKIEKVFKGNLKIGDVVKVLYRKDEKHKLVDGPMLAAGGYFNINEEAVTFLYPFAQNGPVSCLELPFITKGGYVKINEEATIDLNYMLDNDVSYLEVPYGRLYYVDGKLINKHQRYYEFYTECKTIDDFAKLVRQTIKLKPLQE